MSLPALTEPYGYGRGTHISLRTNSSVCDEALEEILNGYSCYPPAIPKIKASLNHSRRYDCVVSSHWFERQKEQLAKELDSIGVTLIIFEAEQRCLI